MQLLQRTGHRALVALVLGLLNGAAALANGTGSMSMPSAPAERSPDDMALDAYNAGVKLIRKADDAATEASKATDPGKLKKAQDRAQDNFRRAQQQFKRATDLNPDMYQAWNYLGYSLRNLGNYPDALDAYNTALKLNPQFADAIEYRGRAYLGLGRVNDAKDAYLALFSSNRKLADQLLGAMKDWLGARRSTPGDLTPATLDEFGKWIDERMRIAGETAGLSPAGTGANWH
ncbi:MAG: tetratricopeptide repeat protein [Steroidobacteraceae bacterium]